MEKPETPTLQPYASMKDQNKAGPTISPRFHEDTHRPSNCESLSCSYKTANLQTELEFEQNEISSSLGQGFLMKGNKQTEYSFGSPYNNRPNLKNHYEQEQEKTSCPDTKLKIDIKPEDITGDKPIKLECPKCKFVAFTEVSYHMRKPGKFLMILFFLTLLWPCALMVLCGKIFKDVLHECPNCGYMISKKKYKKTPKGG